MVDEIALSTHLHKLIGLKSEQNLENLLQLLWQTRNNGLSNSQKSSIHSLLNLPSARDLDPVLACLRSLIRNCVLKNLKGDDGLKLLPADLPLELQNMLLVLLQKHRSHWKEELFLEPHASGWTRSSLQDNVGVSAPLLPGSYSAVSGSLLSLQVDPVPHFNSPNIGGPIPVTAERNVACFPHSTLQNDVGPTEIQGVLPLVKSMTWTVENKGETPTNRVAIITLKLQDYTKSPLNEMEVKFQLTRDTLEAVLISMRYISEQLSQY
ncbi:FAR1-related sequence 3, partial [Perilla frutescens var. hirtella]